MQYYRIARFGCARNHEEPAVVPTLPCLTLFGDFMSIAMPRPVFNMRSEAMIGRVSLDEFRRQRDGEMISWPEVGMVEGPCLGVPWFVLLRLFSCRLVRHSNKMTRRDIHICTLFDHNSAPRQSVLRLQGCDDAGGALWKVKSRCLCARS